jgi:hypothetical protein
MTVDRADAHGALRPELLTSQRASGSCRFSITGSTLFRTRHAVAVDATGPNSVGWSRSSARCPTAAVTDRAAVVGEHHREIGHHPARIMAARRSQPSERVAERLGQPGLVGHPGSSRDPTCDTTPAPSVVTVIAGREVVGCTSEVPPPCVESEPRELRSNRSEQALTRIETPCRTTNIKTLLQQLG